MLRCEMSYRRDVYETPTTDGVRYQILSTYDKGKDEIIIRKIVNGLGYKYLEEGKWETNENYKGHGVKLFESVERAFGFINNLEFDSIAIGTAVNVRTGPDRDNQEWVGEVVVNDHYNDDYPYKVKIDAGDNISSFGVFSEKELTKV